MKKMNLNVHVFISSVAFGVIGGQILKEFGLNPIWSGIYIFAGINLAYLLILIFHLNKTIKNHPLQLEEKEDG